MLENIVIGVIAIILGLIVAFAGYPLFRIILPFVGFVYGFQIGYAVFNGWLISLIVGLALALLLAILAYSVWSVAIGFAGAMLGAAIGSGIGASLGLWGWLTTVIAIGVAVLFFLLALAMKDPFVIISTAMSGAGMVAFGAATLLPLLFGAPGEPRFLYWVVWLTVAVLGFGAQYALFSSAHRYGDMMTASAGPRR